MSNFNKEKEIPNIDQQKDTSEEDLFKIGGVVMHPVYGIGHVESREERKVGTEIYNFAIVSFQNEKLKMTINVNLQKNTIRRLINKEDIPKLLDYLREYKTDLPVKSPERYNINLKKIKSTDIKMLIQVIKDLVTLSKSKKLTPKEVSMLKQSKKTLASEIAFVLSITEEKADEKIDLTCRNL
jgi:RNA polymerase-interacting CarD/CdnL/TRCF family regulator